MENKNNSQQINKIPFKFDSRFVFSDTSTRILKLFGDEKSVETLIMATQLPYVFTSEPVPLVFNFSLSEAMIQESYSKISWIITNKNVPSPILVTFNLSENTIEKTVLVIFELEIVKRELIPEQYHEKIKVAFPEICIETIKNMEKELEEDNKDIYHYESKIFPFSREKIWDTITNFHCIMSKLGMIKDCNMLDSITGEGVELSFRIVSKNKICRLKVNKYKKNEKNNKWVLKTIPLSGPFSHSEMSWTLVKLGDNETLVSNTSKYKEPIDRDLRIKLTKEKKETFITIENILKDRYGNGENSKEKKDSEKNKENESNKDNIEDTKK